MVPVMEPRNADAVRHVVGIGVQGQHRLDERRLPCPAVIVGRRGRPRTAARERLTRHGVAVDQQSEAVKSRRSTIHVDDDI